MLFDARLRPAYSPARVNRALVTNGRIGCVGLSHIHNEYPYQRYEQQNEGFMTGLKSRQFLCECVQNFSDLFPTSPTHSTYLALPQPKFLQRTKNVFNILNPPSPHFKLLQCTSKHFKTFPTHFKTSLKCFRLLQPTPNVFNKPETSHMLKNPLQHIKIFFKNDLPHTKHTSILRN